MNIVPLLIFYGLLLAVTVVMVFKMGAVPKTNAAYQETVVLTRKTWVGVMWALACVSILLIATLFQVYTMRITYNVAVNQHQTLNKLIDAQQVTAQRLVALELASTTK